MACWKFKVQFNVRNFLVRIWAQFAYLFALHECYGIMFNLPIPIIGSRFYLRIDSKSRHQNKLLYAFSSTNFSNQTLGWTQFGSKILFFFNSTVSCFFVANTNMSQHSFELFFLWDISWAIFQISRSKGAFNNYVD